MVNEDKKALRKEAKAKAAVLSNEYRQYADTCITRFLLELSEYQRAQTVFCFVGVGDEINTRAFLLQVLKDGKRLAVPLCTGKGTMEARWIQSLAELKQGRYGLLEPDGSSAAVPMEQVDFAVVPCLAADYKGNRIGHGGGYYDAMFGRYSSVPAAVVCRERLIQEQVPVEPFDHRFSIVVTENGVFRS